MNVNDVVEGGAAMLLDYGMGELNGAVNALTDSAAGIAGGVAGSLAEGA